MSRRKKSGNVPSNNFPFGNGVAGGGNSGPEGQGGKEEHYAHATEKRGGNSGAKKSSHSKSQNQNSLQSQVQIQNNGATSGCIIILDKALVKATKSANKKIKESRSKVNGSTLKGRMNSLSQNKIQKELSRVHVTSGHSTIVTYQESQGFSPTLTKSLSIANSNSNSNSIPMNVENVSNTSIDHTKQYMWSKSQNNFRDHQQQPQQQQQQQPQPPPPVPQTPPPQPRQQQQPLAEERQKLSKNEGHRERDRSCRSLNVNTGGKSCQLQSSTNNIITAMTVPLKGRKKSKVNANAIIVDGSQRAQGPPAFK